MSEMTLDRACEVLNDHRHAGRVDWEPNGGEAVSVGRGWAAYRIRWGAALAIETAARLEQDAGRPAVPTLRDETADVLASAMEAMGDAAQDLAEWRQLGRRWREESADYDFDPKCPTDAGMERTETVLKRIAVARLAIRRFRERRAVDMQAIDPDAEDAPTLRDEAAAVLVQLDELAAIWGDEGVFRRCRDRLRAALAKGGDA